MSHGRMHDAQGVKGTHLRGTVPSKAVLDAVPEGVGTVGHIPDPQPGKATAAKANQTTGVLRFDQQKQRSHRLLDAEGDPVLPGGNRTGTGMGATTTRPTDTQVPGPAAEEPKAPEAVAQDEPEETAAEAPEAPEAVEVPESTPEPEETAEEAAEPEEETPEPEVAEVPWPTEAEELANWLSKRKVQRAKVAELEAWLDIFEVEPDLAEGETATGTVMREVIVSHVDEAFGVVIEL